MGEKGKKGWRRKRLRKKRKSRRVKVGGNWKRGVGFVIGDSGGFDLNTINLRLSVG